LVPAVLLKAHGLEVDSGDEAREVRMPGWTASMALSVVRRRSPASGPAPQLKAKARNGPMTAWVAQACFGA
jgi:hypothetical protein